MLGRCVRCGGASRLRRRSVRRQKNPPRANFDHDEVPDDLQCAGGDLPGRLFPAAGAGSRFDDVGNRTGPDAGSQSDSKHVVRHELLDDAAHLSDDLRPNIAVAVIGAA